MILWLFAIHSAHFADMGPSGLISILGWPYFAGLALVVAGLAYELTRTPLHASRAVWLIVALVVIVYGTASAIEPVAEIVDAWVHVGFVQYIVQHGHPLNNYDARFSWPGGFSLAAVLVAFTGQADALGFIRWFPMFAELSYLAPLLVISRFSGLSRRAGLLGIALYYASNWIFQDYFSPQALNFLFYLVVIAAVLACWRPRESALTTGTHLPDGSLGRRIAGCRAVFTRARLEGHDAEPVWGANVTLIVLGLLALICLASSMSHQLTPYALILALAACLFTRRLGRPELLVVCAIFAVGWLSLGASNYWLGHLGTIFGSVGHLTSTINSSVTSRVSGNVNHVFIVKLRILTTAVLFFFGGVGFLRRATDSRALEALAGAPFLLLAAQNYGGEGLLRVALYSLPFTALLAAAAIMPARAGTVRPLVPNLRANRFTRPLLALASFVAILTFAISTTAVRGGNDTYESFSTGELAAVNYVYDHIHAGQTIGVVAPYLPIGQRDVDSVIPYSSSSAAYSVSVKQEGHYLIKADPAYVILSQSQEAWGELVAGYPKGWELTVEEALAAHGFRIVAIWPTATVLQSESHGG